MVAGCICSGRTRGSVCGVVTAVDATRGADVSCTVEGVRIRPSIHGCSVSGVSSRSATESKTSLDVEAFLAEF